MDLLDFLQQFTIVIHILILNNTFKKHCILKVKFNCNTIFLVNCATVSNGEIGFCHCNTCSENEGDCDAHDECQDGLFCGSNNCSASLGFDSEVDCCYQPILGDEDFCASGIPCGEDEGDCDSNSECQSSLFCGYNNCPVSLGFDFEIDCCSTTQVIESPNYPNSYPNNAYETWLLTDTLGSIITLQFHSFHVRLIPDLKIHTVSTHLQPYS